ncbi:MAG: hypothetical protein JWQ09_4105 [Segetibacter sp.]|nr:hypothetical protein [Segetibacter sp.]
MFWKENFPALSVTEILHSEESVAFIKEIAALITVLIFSST